MSTVSTSAEKLITAEEYAALPNDGRFTELILGRIVELNRPESNHGLYCGNINRILGNFVHQQKLGRVICNDPGVVTRRGPDTVRGGDVLFYSYARVSPGPTPRGYWPAPELIFEVRSPSDRWIKIIAKVQEYLEANVRLVVIVDPEEQRIHAYAPDAAPQVVEFGEYLELGKLLPDVLPNCRLLIDEFFEQ